MTFFSVLYLFWCTNSVDENYKECNLGFFQSLFIVALLVGIVAAVI